jgi:hypothetical protein
MVLFEQIERHVPHDCKILRGIVLADPAMVLVEGQIQDPVEPVFEAPIAAFGAQDLLCIAFQVGDEVPILNLSYYSAVAGRRPNLRDMK